MRNLFIAAKNIKQTEDYLENTKRWSLIQIYCEAEGEEKSITKLSKEYGTQVNYWTKLKEYPMFKKMAEFQFTIAHFKFS